MLQLVNSFLMFSLVHSFQVYLMCYPRKQRKPLACATLGSVCLCQLYLWELRNNVQIFFHVTVACYGTFVIFTRPVQEKLPQYTLQVYHKCDIFKKIFSSSFFQRILIWNLLSVIMLNEWVFFFLLYFFFFFLQKDSYCGFYFP